MTPVRVQALLATLALVLYFAALACRCANVEQSPIVVRKSSSSSPPVEANSNHSTTSTITEEPKLFRMINFERFKRVFKKTYKSWAEEVSRKLLFMARAWRSFQSGIEFKLGKSSSYKSINVMSDWTPAERKRLLNRAGLGSSVVEEEEREEPVRVQEVERAAEAEVEASDIRGEEDVRRRMLEVAAQSGQRDASLEELRAGDSRALRRSKRDAAPRLETATKSSLSVADLMAGGSDGGDENHVTDQVVVAPSAGVQYKEFRMAEYEGLAFGAGNLPSKNKDKKHRRVAEAKETVYEIDHRSCLGAPRFQDDCGACYIYSALAILEWHYCKLNTHGRAQVQFSPQMILDCAHKASCTGGYVRDVFGFASSVGLEPEASWPYLFHRGKCPFKRPLEESPEARSQAAYWKASNLEVTEVAYEQWDEELERGPLAITMATEENFPEYGGGVDEHRGCVPGTDTHAMVLVGRGREDGKDFWLLRNSYGPDWGEHGHYKISRAGMARCVWRGEDAGLAVDSSRLRFRENRAYAAEKVDDFIRKRAERKAAKLDKAALES